MATRICLKAVAECGMEAPCGSAGASGAWPGRARCSALLPDLTFILQQGFCAPRVCSLPIDLVRRPQVKSFPLTQLSLDCQRLIVSCSLSPAARKCIAF